MVIWEIQANTDEQHPNQNVYYGNADIKCVQLQQIQQWKQDAVLLSFLIS